MYDFEKENMKEIAYFAQETYIRKHNRERMVDVIQQKFPKCPIEIIYSMIYAIDAYVDINCI